MKVVLDTNVIVSGLLWTGLPHEVISGILENKVIICSSPAIIEELHDVLSRPIFTKRIKILNTSIEELEETFLKAAEIYPDTEILPIIKNDVEDNKFLACASISKAGYIVSGDDHLLKLKMYQNIPIMTPKRFLRLL